MLALHIQWIPSSDERPAATIAKVLSRIKVTNYIVRQTQAIIIKLSLFVSFFVDQERRIRDMLYIVEGNPDDSEEPKTSADEKERPQSSVAKTR